jgi:hypothetical protein
MNSKKPVSMRLSETTIKELEGLVKRHRVSQADVISILVHCAYLFHDVNEEKLEEWFDVARLS